MKTPISHLAFLTIYLLTPWGLEAGPEDRAAKEQAAREALREAEKAHAKERAEAAKKKAEAAREKAKERADKNGDGEVNKADRQKSHEEWKKKADTDGDGTLSDEEKAAAKAHAAEKAEAKVAERQENQDKRIEHGIEKGYLTDEEAAKLKAEQEIFAAKAESLKADGTLTKEEFQDLRTDLNEMSRDIWVQKHDTEGTQMPVFRVSKDCKLKAEIASMLDSEELSGEEAKKFYHDMKALKHLQAALRSGELDEEQAAKAKAKYDELVGKYFECGDAE